MTQAKNGDKVRINFTGTLEDGTVFDTTHLECTDDDCGCEEGGPVEVTLGGEEFFPQVEAALVGMAPGEKKKVVIAAAEAFGGYDDDLVFTVPRDQVPDNIDPKVGQELELIDEKDESIVVTVTDVNDETVTIDANHPLTGEDLTYEVELLEIL